jgi:hypothetical protein
MVLGALIAGGIGFLAGRLTAPKKDKHEHKRTETPQQHQPANLTPVHVNHGYQSQPAAHQPTWNYQPTHQTAPQINGGMTVNIQNLLQIAQQGNSSNHSQTYPSAQSYLEPTYSSHHNDAYEYEDEQALDIDWPPTNHCEPEHNYTMPLATNAGYQASASSYARIYIS